MSLLNRRLQLYWNGKTVMLGATTSVIAYETAARHMRQFGGLEFRRWSATAFDAGLLDRIIAGERTVLAYNDDTGSAMALIEAL